MCPGARKPSLTELLNFETESADSASIPYDGLPVRRQCFATTEIGDCDRRKSFALLVKPSRIRL
jgi:hypothetical protein